MKVTISLPRINNLRLANIRVFSLLAITLLSISLSAASVPTLVASKDTYISGAAKDTSYGNSTTLEISGRGTPYARKIYLSFDLTGFEESTSFDATTSLSLTLLSSNYLIGDANGNVSLSVYGFSDSATFTNDITWNNAPKNRTDSSTEFQTLGRILLGSITIDSTTGGTSVTLSGINLANYLNSYVGKEVTIVIGVDSLLAGNQSYPGFRFSSANANVADTLKPHLSLSTVPEPATISVVVGLIALAAGAYWQRCKKQCTHLEICG